MRHAHKLSISKGWSLTLLALGLIFETGCITYSHHAIPADRLPPELRMCEKGCRVPVNLALLSQAPPRSYVIGAGDVLSIYIRGILPPNVDDNAPVLQNPQLLQTEYYPPIGTIMGPSAGIPIHVSDDGTIPIPIIGSIKVEGLTIQQAAEKIVQVVVEKKVVVKDREYIYVNLIRPRVHRVMVIREETKSDAQTIMPRTASSVAKRGSAEVVDLPAFENDILHALTASGGMPGTDALNEVWILRRGQRSDGMTDAVWDGASQAANPAEFISCCPEGATAKRIQLWTRDGSSPCFSQADVILQDGDIVYLQARQQEVFYTGGLITGAEIPLPRDHDIDVLEAVAMANASVGGPGGAGGNVFRAGAGPGNIIPPTRALVLRKVGNGQQVAIRVDLERAVRDPKQRVNIQAGDFIMLYYKPGETFTNAALNFVNFTLLIPAGN
ncbi:MAG: polysaccharide biosynthesis/export family protein [Pirellulaceae bacterium]|nr:polysaccharide biosynthesis/export family protein [Pirellulaceae bacterium]